MAVTGLSGYIGRWALPNFTVISETNDEAMSFSCMDYVIEDNVVPENCDMVVVGYRKGQTEKGEAMGTYVQKNLRLINSKGDIKNNSEYYDYYPAELGKYTQTKFVRLNTKCSGLLASNDSGHISILPMPFH